jgi:hypothetical protein
MSAENDRILVQLPYSTAELQLELDEFLTSVTDAFIAIEQWLRQNVLQNVLHSHYES